MRFQTKASTLTGLYHFGRVFISGFAFLGSSPCLYHAGALGFVALIFCTVDILFTSVIILNKGFIDVPLISTGRFDEGQKMGGEQQGKRPVQPACLSSEPAFESSVLI